MEMKKDNTNTFLSFYHLISWLLVCAFRSIEKSNGTNTYHDEDENEDDGVNPDDDVDGDDEGEQGGGA